jgi:hypothetical protein
MFRDRVLRFTSSDKGEILDALKWTGLLDESYPGVTYALATAYKVSR